MVVSPALTDQAALCSSQQWIHVHLQLCLGVRPEWLLTCNMVAITVSGKSCSSSRELNIAVTRTQLCFPCMHLGGICSSAPVPLSPPSALPYAGLLPIGV